MRDQSVASVENLIRTLPLPYREEAVHAWRERDVSKISIINDSRKLLKTEIQKRAHGVLPLLIFIEIIEVTPCCLCLFDAQITLQKSLEKWTIGDHAALQDKLSEALTLNLASCIKNHSAHRSSCKAHSDRGDSMLSSFSQNSRIIAKSLSIWKRWGTPLADRLGNLLRCMINAHLAKPTFEWDDGYVIALDLMFHLASQDDQPKILSQIKNILLNHRITRRALMKHLMRLLPEIGSDKELFFNLSGERFEVLMAVMNEKNQKCSIVKNLLEDDESVLKLDQRGVARLAQFYILSDHQRSANLRDLILSWMMKCTHFDVDLIIAQLPQIEVVELLVRSTKSEDSQEAFTCQVAECSLPQEYHLTPTEKYSYLLWELILRSASEHEIIKDLPILLCSSPTSHPHGEVYREIIKLLNSFVGLQSPSFFSILQFLDSGCLLDAISWFVRNAHRLSPSHLDWLERVLSISAKTDGRVSQLVADILMFLVDEESSDNNHVGCVTSGGSVEPPPKTIDQRDQAHNVWGVRAIQIQRSMNISRVLKTLCQARIFDLQTLLTLINFLITSSVAIVSRQSIEQFRVEEVGDLDGFPRWLHCIDVVLENIVEVYVPPEIRQKYRDDMPDVDEKRLNVPGDILRELRELADQIIIAVHTRVLNISGDPSLLNASLRCLRSALIIHTTQINGLLSRIRQVWHIIDNVLSSLVIPASSIDLAWSVVSLAYSHAEEFTQATIGVKRWDSARSKLAELGHELAA